MILALIPLGITSCSQNSQLSLVKIFDSILFDLINYYGCVNVSVPEILPATFPLSTELYVPGFAVQFTVQTAPDPGVADKDVVVPSLTEVRLNPLQVGEHPAALAGIVLSFIDPDVPSVQLKLAENLKILLNANTLPSSLKGFEKFPDKPTFIIFIPPPNPTAVML